MSQRRIRNWERFQHYQTGKRSEKAPDWIKLYPRLLNDYEYSQLEDKARIILIELFMLASEFGGALPPIGVICFRLRRHEKEVKYVLDRLPHWIETENDPASNVLANGYQPASLEEKRIEEKKKEIEIPARRRIAFPSNWRPSENHFLIGEERGFSRTEVAEMAEAMGDWARSHGKTMLDWDAAFRGWIRRQNKPQKGSPGVSRTVAAARELIEELHERKRDASLGDGDSVVVEFPDTAPRRKAISAPVSASPSRSPDG